MPKPSTVTLKKTSQQSSSKAQDESLPTSHIDDAMAMILLRDTYKRDRGIFLQRMIILLSCALGIAFITIGLTATREDQFRYFFTETDGTLRESVPLNRPVEDLGQVLTWFTNSIVEANTYNFVKYQQELTKAKNNFTDEGWAAFEKALKDSGNLETVRAKKLNSYATPTAAPVVRAQGNVNGRTALRVEMPLVITFESVAEKRSQNVLIQATIVRRPVNEHPLGMGIAQIVAR